MVNKSDRHSSGPRTKAKRAKRAEKHDHDLPGSPYQPHRVATVLLVSVQLILFAYYFLTTSPREQQPDEAITSLPFPIWLPLPGIVAIIIFAIKERALFNNLLPFLLLKQEEIHRLEINRLEKASATSRMCREIDIITLCASLANCEAIIRKQGLTIRAFVSEKKEMTERERCRELENRLWGKEVEDLEQVISQLLEKLAVSHDALKLVEEQSRGSQQELVIQHEKKLQELKRRVKQQNLRLSAHIKETTNLREQVRTGEAAKQQLLATEGKLVAANEKLLSLEVEVDKLQAKLATTGNECTRLQAVLVSARAETNRQCMQSNSFKYILAAAEDRLKKIQAKLVTEDKKRTRFQAGLASARAENNRQRIQSNSFQQECSATQRKLTAVEVEVKIIQAELATEEEKCTGLQAVLESAGAETTTLRIKSKGFQQECSATQRKLTAVEVEVKIIQAELAAQKKEGSKLLVTLTKPQEDRSPIDRALAAVSKNPFLPQLIPLPVLEVLFKHVDGIYVKGSSIYLMMVILRCTPDVKPGKFLSQQLACSCTDIVLYETCETFQLLLCSFRDSKIKASIDFKEGGNWQQISLIIYGRRMYITNKPKSPQDDMTLDSITAVIGHGIPVSDTITNEVRTRIIQAGSEYKVLLPMPSPKNIPDAKNYFNGAVRVLKRIVWLYRAREQDKEQTCGSLASVLERLNNLLEVFPSSDRSLPFLVNSYIELITIRLIPFFKNGDVNIEELLPYLQQSQVFPQIMYEIITLVFEDQLIEMLGVQLQNSNGWRARSQQQLEINQLNIIYQERLCQYWPYLQQTYGMAGVAGMDRRAVPVYPQPLDLQQTNGTVGMDGRAVPVYPQPLDLQQTNGTVGMDGRAVPVYRLPSVSSSSVSFNYATGHDDGSAPLPVRPNHRNAR